MQKNSNRRGLALGAIFALVASLFATAPASANMVDGANIGVYPVAENGTTTSAFVGTLVDDFPIYVQARPGNAALTSNVVVRIEKTAGTNMDVVFSASGSVASLQGVTASSPVASRSGVIQAGSSSATVSAIVSGGIAHLNFVASSTSGLASWSPVTLRITVFQDVQGGAPNDVINSDEWRTTQTLTFLHPSALERTLTVTPVVSGSPRLTASSTVTGVNLANLGGTFKFARSKSGTVELFDKNVTAAQAFARAGAVTDSDEVTGGVQGGDVFTVGLYYFPENAANTTAITNGITVSSLVTVTAGGVTATALVVTVTTGANASQSAGTTTSGLTYAVRPNRTYTVTITAMSNSSTVSGEAVTVALSGAGLALNARTISIDGGAATTSYPTALALTTGANGSVTFTLGTSGFTDTDANFVATVSSLVSAISKTVTLNPELPGFKVVNEFDIYSAATGASVTLNMTVEDIWGQASDRTNQRIRITRGGTGFAYAETVSFVAVTAGKASVVFTPTPATRTGSATVDTLVQTLNPDTNQWVDGNAGTQIVVNVSALTDAFTGSALASASASISYRAAVGEYSWSAQTVTVRSLNAGAAVVITAPGVLVQNQADAKTYSAPVTLRTNSSGNLALKFASTKAGTHTISYSVGGVTTTSRLVITAAQVDRASKITLAAADMVAGQTTTITGVVADAFDNPVEYTGTDKKLVVSWTGRGLPFNIGSAVNTDEDGKFTFQVLVLAGETGTGVATVTFKPTAVASDNVTVTRTYTIAAPAAVVAPEVSAVIGTFNGRWAVRVENAKGAVVSVKVGNRWVKYTSLNDNYLFSRKSRVGATLPVAVYVNGQLENVATITIK